MILTHTAPASQWHSPAPNLRLSRPLAHGIQARRRISESLRARWKDPEYRASRKKITITEETRAKLSAKMELKWAEGDYRKRNTVNGSHSEERKAKIAAAVRAKWKDPEYRNRTLSGIRKAHSSNSSFARRKPEPGSPEDIEWRNRISEAMKARWQDEQFREAQACMHAGRVLG